MRSRSISPLPLAAAASTLVLLPTLRMGYLRDDWLMLWAKLEPATAPRGAPGVFFRPVAEAWWALGVRLGGDSPWATHSLQFLCGLLLLLGLWRVTRRLALDAVGGAWLIALVGLHVALLESRVWAAASNGLLALLFGVFALERFLAGRRWIAALFFALALGARIDAVALLPIALALRGGRVALRWQIAAAALCASALALTFLAASGGFEWRPWDAGRAIRLLLFPWGTALPEALQIALAVASTAAAMFFARASGPRKWLLFTVLAIAWAPSFLPWNAAGRYLAFAILAAGLLLALNPPSSRRFGLALSLWCGLHLISGIAGNTARDLLRRSRVETELYRLVRDVPSLGSAVELRNPPPMGWESSAADAENVVSAARRQLVSVESGADAAIRFDGEHWRWE